MIFQSYLIWYVIISMSESFFVLTLFMEIVLEFALRSSQRKLTIRHQPLLVVANYSAETDEMMDLVNLWRLGSNGVVKSGHNTTMKEQKLMKLCCCVIE